MTQPKVEIDYYKSHLGSDNGKIQSPDNENEDRPYALVRGGQHPPAIRVIQSFNCQKVFPLAFMHDIDWDEGSITIRDSHKFARINGRNLFPLYLALSQYKVASICVSDEIVKEDDKSVFIETITFGKNED